MNRLRTSFIMFITISILCLAAVVLIASPAVGQQEGGYAEPEGAPPRVPARDIVPVYRGPSIDTLATIRQHGILRVGVAVTEPAVMHDAEGELVGTSIDLARHLAEDMGVELELVETSWSRIIPDLVDRRFDVIASALWVTPTRALVVNFSDTTAAEGIYLIASTEAASGMLSPESFDRPDVRIVVYAGTIQEEIASREFSRATLVKVEGDEDHVEPVVQGKAHALLVPTYSPQVIVERSAGKLFLPFEEPLRSTGTALAVRKGDPDFLNYLNSWLTVQRDDGWLEERIEYWSDPAHWAQ